MHTVGMPSASNGQERLSRTCALSCAAINMMSCRDAAFKLGCGQLLPHADKCDPGKQQPLRLPAHDLGHQSASDSSLQPSAVAVGAPRCAAFSGARDESSAGIDAKAPGMTSKRERRLHLEGRLQQPRQWRASSGGRRLHCEPGRSQQHTDRSGHIMCAPSCISGQRWQVTYPRAA